MGTENREPRTENVNERFSFSVLGSPFLIRPEFPSVDPQEVGLGDTRRNLGIPYWSGLSLVTPSDVCEDDNRWARRSHFAQSSRSLTACVGRRNRAV